MLEIAEAEDFKGEYLKGISGMIKSLQKQQKKYIYDQGFQLGVCRPLGVPIGT